MERDEHDSVSASDASSTEHDRPRSRRSVLALGAAGLAAGIGGCSSLAGRRTSPSETDQGAVIRDISFEGQQMVVRLREDHQLELLNLIGPEGAKYNHSRIARGETTVSLQILDISPEDSFHYPVGESTLVGVASDNEYKLSVDLDPSLSIISARQYSGSRDRDMANISWNVENSGNAPTWIYNIYYTRVPNEESEARTASKGEPSLDLIDIDSDQEAILQPGEQKWFTSYEPPLIFEEEPNCTSDSITGEVYVRSPSQGPVTTEFSVRPNGSPSKLGQSGAIERYTCTEFSIEVTNNGDSGA